MKKKKIVEPFELNNFKQQFQNFVNDTDLISIRVNGRLYQFNKDGTIIVSERLKPVEFINEIFEDDYITLSDRVSVCLGGVC